MECIEKIVGYGDVFERTLNAYESGYEVIIHQGGTGSGKTEDIMVFLMFHIALIEKNKVITIVSESRPHLDIGVIRILKKYLNQLNLYSTIQYNDTKGIVIFGRTGSIIEFFSADRIEKALGARRDWLYGNEINSLKQAIWDELARRSDHVIGDFNPTIQFWLEDWIINYDKTCIIKTNFLNNPFLKEIEKDRIKKRALRDENFKKIHIDCEYGGAEGLIYPNWSYGEFDTSLPYSFGLDFGFHPDPDAMSKIAIDEKRKKIYVKECFYLTQLSVGDLKRLVKQHAQRRLVIADIDNRLIEELKAIGINIRSAEKASGSVIEGIRLVQNYDIITDKESINLVKELRNYVWNDKKSGVPISDFNHLLDGVRYNVQALTRKRKYF